jgi:predicted kinase
LARAHNARFVGLFLTADLATRLARIELQKHDASDATRDIALKQELSEIGAIDWHVIDASGSPDDTLHQGMARLSGPGPASRDGR